MAKKTKQDDKKQSQRFVETAKELEVDESGESFERVVNKIAKPKSRKPNKHSHNEHSE